MAKLRTTEAPPRTIDESLHTVWLANKRKNDVPALMLLAKKKKLPCSKPTIEKALLYGHCLNDTLTTVITDFFVNRNESEKKQAEKLVSSEA